MAGAKLATDTANNPMRETALQRISTFENETISDEGDYRMWIGSGPFNLRQNETEFAYFAFVAGTDLADLQFNADAAVEKYQHILTTVNEYEILPNQFHVSQNYQNPFDRTTRIDYQIPRESNITLEIFDALGRKVRTLLDEHKSAGNYTFEFNSQDLTNGTYFYRISAGELSVMKKMLLLK